MLLIIAVILGLIQMPIMTFGRYQPKYAFSSSGYFRRFMFSYTVLADVRQPERYLHLKDVQTADERPYEIPVAAHMIKTFLMILMFSSSALAGDSCCDISSD